MGQVDTSETFPGQMSLDANANAVSCKDSGNLAVAMEDESHLAHERDEDDGDWGHIPIQLVACFNGIFSHLLQFDLCQQLLQIAS